MKKFRPRAAVAADAVEGYVIEAKEGGNTVQIFRAGSDGEPVGIKSKAEYKDLKRSIGEDGKLLLGPCDASFCVDFC